MTIAQVKMSSLTQLIAEFAGGRVENQINQDVAILGSKALEEVEPDGGEVVVSILSGANPSVGFMQDFGQLAQGHARTPEKARAMPTNVFGRVEMGRGASHAKLTAAQAASEVDLELQNLAESVARVLGRGIFGGTASPSAIGTWSGTAANSTVSLTFTDISLFRPNMAVDFIDTSASLAYTVRVQSVTPGTVGSSSANIAGTVVFINDIPSPATGAPVALGATGVATDDLFRLRGETAGFGGASAVVAGLASFDDIAGAGASSAFMGVTPGANGWRGQYMSSATAYSQELVLGFLKRIQQLSAKPTHVVMSPQLAAAHAVSTGYHGSAYGVTGGLSAARPMDIDRSADKYAAALDSGLRLGGLPVIEDANLQANRIVIHNRNHVKLACWKKMGLEEEAGDAKMVSRSYLSYEWQFLGIYQLYATKRSAIGVMDGFTGL